MEQEPGCVNGNNDGGNDGDRDQTFTIKLPIGGYLKNPFGDLNYTGKTNKQNPIIFL